MELREPVFIRDTLFLKDPVTRLKKDGDKMVRVGVDVTEVPPCADCNFRELDCWACPDEDSCETFDCVGCSFITECNMDDVTYGPGPDPSRPSFDLSRFWVEVISNGYLIHYEIEEEGHTKFVEHPESIHIFITQHIRRP